MPKQIYVGFFLNKINPQENVDIGKIKSKKIPRLKAVYFRRQHVHLAKLKGGQTH